MLGAILAIGAISFFGCGDDGRPGSDGGRIDGSADAGPSCASRTDTDGDGIADVREGDGDPDGDGVPSFMDLDSDGDGLSDMLEANSSDACAPADSDGDGTPDFADADSDNDGLTDAAETAAGTDPTNTDSDGDGFFDLAEDAAGTDPLDPTDTIPETDFFVVLPYQGDRAMRTLRFGTDIQVADVFFLVDTTGSMGGERSNLILGLQTVIIPGIEAEIPNVQFGAGGFDDYPYGGYGSPSTHDLPFYLLRTIGPAEDDLGAWSITSDATTCPMDAAVNDIGSITGAPNGMPDILEAIEGLPCHFGVDGPESYVPALWVTATGRGVSWPGGSIPDQMCPSIPDEVSARRGYPCFRPGALPIVVFFGDATFHNGPGMSDPYAEFPAPQYAEAIAELTAIGARVLPVYSGSGDGDPALIRAQFEGTARDTGSVRADGTPLLFMIAGDGTGLSTAVVDAVRELVGGTPQDVSTRTVNVPGNPDNFDATLFIKSIVPNEGYGPTPGTGYSSKDTTTFYDVIPGTLVDFDIDFWNDVRMPADVAEIFLARIIVVGNGVADLDERRVYIIVPPEGSVILI
jgi:hypothetical protein